MKNLIVFLSFILFTGWCAAASAAVIPELYDFLTGEIETISQAIHASEENGLTTPEEANANQDQESMFFRRFLIRIRAMVGFDQQFGKIQVLPEIELVWQRDFKKD